MRKYLKTTIVLGLFGIGFFLLFKTYQSYNTQKEVTNRIQTLQHACFESLNGGQICIDEFDSRKPTVIIYFHPECEHCQYEALEIGRNARRFEEANLIMVTPDDSIKRLKDFASNYHLWEVDNLAILIDRKREFKKRFGSAVAPSVFIYGTDRKLVKTYKGETKIEAIINSLE